MIDSIQQYSGQLTVPLLCFCLPGILFLLNGVRTIRIRKRASIGRDSHFRWKKPVILEGERAVKEGKRDIIFGVFLLFVGITSLIGIFS